jgi:hypothetical protein
LAIHHHLDPWVSTVTRLLAWVSGSIAGAAARYFFADGKLYIDLMADSGTMRLDLAGAAAASAESDAEAVALQAMVAGVMANPWKWTSFTSTTEELAVETPASYMVTLPGQPDCLCGLGARILADLFRGCLGQHRPLPRHRLWLSLVVRHGWGPARQLCLGGRRAVDCPSR